jgi:hypothetical protein
MKRAGDYLTAIIDADLFNKARTYSVFFSSWAQITQTCGIAAAAGYSRIRELEKGVLVVEADHPGWVQLLQTKAQRILVSARRRFPELDIRGISFTLSKPPLPGEPVEGDKQELRRLRDGPPPEALGSGPESGMGDKSGAPSKPGAWERIGDGDFKDSLKRLEQSIRDREKSAAGKSREKKRRSP